MIPSSTYYKNQLSRRWLGLLILVAYAQVGVTLRADGPTVASSDGVPDPGTLVAQSAPSDSPPLPVAVASSEAPPVNLAPHAGVLGLRDTGASTSASSPTASSSTTDSSSAPASSSTAAPAPSPNATVNLVNLLVAQHVITKAAGDALVQQAEQEADTARAQIATTQAVAERALTAQTAPAPAPTPAPAASPAPASDDEVQVTYVPDEVKNQIRDEVTEKVMKQTQDENLAQKSDIPDWVKRFRVTGDIRTRFEGDFYPSGSAIGNFTNYNSINTSSSGFNVDKESSSFVPLPQYNVDQDRDRFRLRARIGAEIDLTQGFTAGLRLGTGSDDSPVSENQTLGASNSAQGGNFGKYAIWLDRAFIKYEMGSQPDRDLAFTVGRFDNPFFHTSMIWSDDLAFDGAVVQGKYKVADGVTPFFAAGGFPIFNTDLNFSSTQAAKFSSEDKYLLAGQVGTNWAINKDFSAKVAAAYYYFDNIEGKVSSPMLAVPGATGNTDDSRPAFAQNGNTYIALRDYSQDPNYNAATNPDTTANEYYGLATPFHEFAFTSQFDYSGLDPFHIWLTGEFVKNLAFDRSAIINNGSPFSPGPQNNTLTTDPNSFVGGDTGWIVKFNVGKVSLEQLWDWNVNLSYRYVESDATVDGFTDSDFGGSLAGTNLKGYTLGGNLGLSHAVSLGLRWMSADDVAGPTYKSDLIQFDLNAKF